MTDAVQHPRRRRALLLRVASVLGVLVVLGAGAIYALNPFGTATLDPRARILGVTPYRIASSSMAPTLEVGDLVVVGTVVRGRDAPHRGDIIVFVPPQRADQTYIARVAGVPGDALSIIDGVLHVDGEPVRERYIVSSALKTEKSRAFAETRVPPGQLFVLGDNRDHAEDSRYFGFVSADAVIGRVTAVWHRDGSARAGRAD